MKSILEYVLLGVLIIASVAGIVSASCTPAERQAFQAGALTGAAACVFVARCAGVPDVADFCQLTKDALRQIELGLEDANCPLPERDASHE